MFNNYTRQPAPQRVTANVHVTEQRAPTDESVRLLREMEDRAQASILSATRVQDLGIDCVIHKQRDMLNDRTQYAIVYSLNGKKHRVNHDFQHGLSESAPESVRRLCDELRAALAAHMAAHLLAGVFKFKDHP